MPTSLRLHALLVKKEGTYGVDPTPGTGDGVRISTPDGLWPLLRPVHHWPNHRNDAASNSLVPVKPGVPVGRFVEIEIPWEMKGKGSAYAAEGDIEANPLLQACGLSVAVDVTGGAEKITYTMADTGHAGATLYGYAGALRYIVTGCRGNLVWPLRAGENANWPFRMMGMLSANPTTQAVPSATYDSSLPPVGKAAAFTINPGASWSPDVLEAEFTIGNEPQIVEDASAADGINEISLEAGRDPRLTCTVRKDALTDYDPSALLTAVTSHLIDWTHGQSQYNRAKLDINESYLLNEPEPVNYRGFAGYRITYGVKTFSIIFD